MKKELDYFMIDGEFGGNQDWFTNIVMNVGGCGAATACDSCIYLAKYKGMKELYPFDLEQMDRRNGEHRGKIPHRATRQTRANRLQLFIIKTVNRQMRRMNLVGDVALEHRRVD